METIQQHKPRSVHQAPETSECTPSAPNLGVYTKRPKPWSVHQVPKAMECTPSAPNLGVYIKCPKPWSVHQALKAMECTSSASNIGVYIKRPKSRSVHQAPQTSRGVCPSSYYHLPFQLASLSQAVARVWTANDVTVSTVRRCKITP